MQQIGTATRKALAQLSESSELPASDYERGMLVWNGLVEMFGSGVIREYGDTPPRLWAEAISSLTDEDLRRGFSALLRQKRQYAPNLTEFVDACQRKSEPVRYLGVPLTADGWKQLGPPPIEKRAKPEVVDSWIAKMRAKVTS